MIFEECCEHDHPIDVDVDRLSKEPLRTPRSAIRAVLFPAAVFSVGMSAAWAAHPDVRPGHVYSAPISLRDPSEADVRSFGPAYETAAFARRQDATFGQLRILRLEAGLAAGWVVVVEPDQVAGVADRLQIRRLSLCPNFQTQQSSLASLRTMALIYRNSSLPSTTSGLLSTAIIKKPSASTRRWCLRDLASSLETRR